ncbi:hypothetical protein CDAR_412001 [Caerostris darwini]|uniref:Uncharacterized protein n=1 Tax=Caerostris darwini TaxID=1538125 RepID=A0AAV4WGD7_9ARAC|nr:hypothetical protein CDAR_412001 [Caerostris darwini]
MDDFSFIPRVEVGFKSICNNPSNQEGENGLQTNTNHEEVKVQESVSKQLHFERISLIPVVAGILHLLANKSNQQDHTGDVKNVQLMRSITDKTVKLAFPNQRLPSSMKLILNPFQISKINQSTSFSFGRDDKVTLSHKFSALLQKKSIYLIAIKIIAVRSNGHEQNVRSNRECQKQFHTNLVMSLLISPYKSCTESSNWSI